MLGCDHSGGRPVSRSWRDEAVRGLPPIGPGAKLAAAGMRSRRALLTALGEAGFRPLEDDPHALVQVLHQPSARRGLFGQTPMRSVALLDLLGDSPSRFLELALETGRAIDQLVTGHSVGEDLEHPTLQAMAAMMSPGRGRKPSWRQPPHQLVIVMAAEPAPSWAGAVLDGAVHDHRRRTAVTAIRDTASGQLHLPSARSPRLSAVLAWSRELLEAVPAAREA
jgi:hypothetical protein